MLALPPPKPILLGSTYGGILWMLMEGASRVCGKGRRSEPRLKQSKVKHP